MRADRIARALFVWLVLSCATPLEAQPRVDAAVAAATETVREAFGGEADVTLDAPVLSLVPGSAAIATAVAEPASLTGGRMRFVLYDGGEPRRRVGRLTADVRVVAPHLRVRQALRPGTVLTADLVDAVRADIGRQRLGALPTLRQAAEGTTRGSLREGDVVTVAVLAIRPLVASGDEVVTVARVGALEVRGRAIAAQSGALGETVIVVNPDSRKRLRGRVIAEDVVEVGHGS